MKRKTTLQEIAERQKINPQADVSDLIANADTEYKVTQYVKECGVEYSAMFIPQSRSRNAADKDKSINWLVTLKNDRAVLNTDYSQGIGHIPHIPKDVRPRTNDHYHCEHEAAEKGRYYPKQLNSFMGSRPIPAPSVADVVHSLLLDSSVLDHDSYESWAAECGYDEDSREGERIYQA